MARAAAGRPERSSSSGPQYGRVVRYLTLSADYKELSLRDESGGQVSPVDLNLAPELQRALEAWNLEYQRIIRFDAGQRTRVAPEIKALDDRGIQLAADIRRACQPEAKVSYYSEGLGKLLA